MIIGITGIFGSGKTTVAELFSKYGYKVINADEIGHKLLNKKPIKDKIIKEFGKSILTKGKIDRRKLKNIVFYENKSLVRLNKIIHPEIIKEIKSIIKLLNSKNSKGLGNSKNFQSKSKNKRIIVDGALLIEAKALNLIDKLIVVKISKKEQLKRLLRKKKYSKKETNNIIKSQLSQKEKLKYAGIVLDNSKSLNYTKKQVDSIARKLT